MSLRVREHDWSGTPLGPPRTWPQSLRTVLDLLLQARQPMFLAWGAELTLLYNDAYAAVLGSKHPRALGQPFATAWSDIWPQFGPLVQRVLDGEALCFADLPITMWRNGYPEDTWFSFSYTPLRDESGRVAGLFCACDETTARIRSEQALRANEAQLEARVAERTAELDRVWRNSRDLLVIIEADGVFRAVNPAWTAILGHEPAEIVGRNVLDFILPEDAAASRAALDQAFGQRDLTDFENRFRHRDGTPRWIAWRTSVEGGLVYAYGRHITAEKRQAEALGRAEEQLRQSQKMEAIGQLTGGVAHDFNNLLTVVIGSLALLQRRLAHQSSLLRFVDAASSAAKRGAQLTHQLLAFARRQPLQAADVDLNEVISGIGSLLQRTVGGDVPLEIACHAAPLPVRVDRNQLEMAVLNLVVNARDASPRGGRIVVATAPAPAGGTGGGARQISLTVRDEGAGMTPDVLERVFEPFFTTKESGVGTGLGLSMVYGFVRQSGGDVEIESAPGRGTRVCLWFPAGNWAGPEAEEPAGAARPAQGERILVVEDDPGVRAVAVAALEQLGYPVREAENGEAALRLLDEDPGIDLLFTDVVMPGSIDGIALARTAWERRPELRILVTSGRLPDTTKLDGVLQRRGAFLAKPYQPVELALAVQAILDAEGNS